MKKKKLTTVNAFILCLAILICTVGCQAHRTDNEVPQPVQTRQSVDLMANICPNEVTTQPDADLYAAEMTDFALRLFQACEEPSKNTLVSPLSVTYALAMTANGANGQTLEEMEAVLGGAIQNLNPYLRSYRQSTDDEEIQQLHLANSIWFTNDERFTVNQGFLQSNADYYNAGIYEATFDDATLQDINNWVANNTDGMIPKILDQIPHEALMYLINAMAFDARWASAYESYEVSDGSFTLEDGSQQNAEYMYSDEDVYLCSENASGFIKYYEGYRFAFAALLPNEGIPLSEYISSLDGDELYRTLSMPQYETVETKLPKFETEYSTELAGQLTAMGMGSAFNAQIADFSGIGSSTAGNICISRVLHKTYMCVDENGTKAAASTVVEMTDASAMVQPEEIKTVHLDRPFLYMIIDTNTSIPIFIGTMNSLS